MSGLSGRKPTYHPQPEPNCQQSLGQINSQKKNLITHSFLNNTFLRWRGLIPTLTFSIVNINIVCAIPELSDKLVKEDREYYSSKFITRAQPWPSSKWRKHIPCACCSGIALFKFDDQLAIRTNKKCMFVSEGGEVERVTCHLHGLKVRASLKWSWSKCTARNDAKTFHPLGIV